MRSVLRSSGQPRVRLSRTLPRAGALLVLLAVVGALSIASAGATYVDPESYMWTNGSVTCEFNDSLPSVVVSPNALDDAGIGMALGQITEESTSGVADAIAVPSTAEWEPENASSAQSYAMNYSEYVNVTNATDTARTVGQAWVSLSFSLNRTPPNATLADVVSMQLSIQNWPWQSARDTLALVIPLWSEYSGTEHVLVNSSSSSRVESVNNSDGHPDEYFEAGLSASTGTGAVMSVSPQTTVVGGIATTTLTFGPGAGGATDVAYQATLGITPSTRVLGLPLYDYLAVAGGAGLVALVVGVGTRRVREGPSDLTYVEEAK